jgi:hypothetical protein
MEKTHIVRFLAPRYPKGDATRPGLAYPCMFCARVYPRKFESGVFSHALGEDLLALSRMRWGFTLAHFRRVSSAVCAGCALAFLSQGDLANNGSISPSVNFRFQNSVHRRFQERTTIIGAF